MTRLTPLLTLTAVVTLVASLALPWSAHAQKAFKMGAIVPVSGPAAAFGLGVQRGMELAAEDVGVFTVGNDKYKIEVATYDTVYDPAKTVAAMNRAVYNDGVKYGVIIGAGVHPPILPIIRETGFLDLAFAAAGRQITNGENPTVFRIMASSDQLYQTHLIPIIEKLGVKRIAFLGPNDELGKNDAKVIMSPFVFTFFFSTDLVIFDMVGGLGSFWGPLAGSVLLTALGEQLFAAGYYKSLVYAVVLLVVILVLPGGLIQLPRMREAWAARRLRWGKEPVTTAER